MSEVLAVNRGGVAYGVWLIIFFVLFSSVSPRCSDNNGTGRPEISFRVLDEFNDEAGVLREGGTVEVTCDQGRENGFYVNVLCNEFGDPLRLPVITTVLRAPISSYDSAEIFAGIHDCSTRCYCSQGHTRYEDVYFGAFFCDDLNMCSEDDSSQVCLSLGRMRGKQCGIMQHCDRLNKGFRVCRKTSTGSFSATDNECSSVELFSTQNYWPEFEVGEFTDEAACSEMEDYWGTMNHLGLRDVIPINSTTCTLKPKNSKIPYCYDDNKAVTCKLWTLSKRAEAIVRRNFTIWNRNPAQKKMLRGTCKEGWTIDLDQIWESWRAKLICISGKNRARWQFYLFATVAKLIHHNQTCQWPKWLKQEDTLAQGGKCKKTVRFNYPPSIRGKKFQFSTQEVFEPTTTPETTTTTVTSTTTSTVATTTQSAFPSSQSTEILDNTTSIENRTSSQQQNHTTATTVPSVDKTTEKGVSLNVIIGPVVAGLGGLVIVGLVTGFLVVFCKRKRLEKKEKDRRTEMPDTNTGTEQQ